MNGRPRTNRRSFTLLEIVLAIGLAATAIALLAQLVDQGNRAAASSRDQSQAMLIAQSLMSEFTSGIAEPMSTSGVWEMDDLWTYDVVVALNGSQTINVITVTVSQNIEVSPASFTMTQWLAIPPEPEEEEETTEDETA